MILTAVQNTGYSLGLPLWWVSEPTKLTTGCVQGISMTLSGTPTDVFLSSYRRTESGIGLTFSTIHGILCSVYTSLTDETQTVELRNETSAGSPVRFLSGCVTLYPNTTDTDLDLTGARVCPKYVIFVDDNAPNTPQFKLVAQNSDGTEWTVGTVDVQDLTVEDSPEVAFTITSSGGVISYTGVNVAADQTLAELADTGDIFYINGTPVTSGAYIFHLPALGANSSWESEGWRVSPDSGGCIKIAMQAQTPSCVPEDYAARLSPSNYTHECPLDIAFPSGALVMDEIYDRRFNPEYEVGSGGSAGLVWDEFSQQHDVF